MTVNTPNDRTAVLAKVWAYDLAAALVADDLEHYKRAADYAQRELLPLEHGARCAAQAIAVGPLRLLARIAADNTDAEELRTVLELSRDYITIDTQED